ncbi:tail fiber domain-containing protein [Kitasatospora sp. NPDC057940]|uniref:tail fiber domain-containing protein n=1 Tax=Kitasatospora sp. NPDC057940 TaxID=3346285 RepID=UPI0036DB33D3
MSITSYPFDGQAASESQYSYLFRELQDSGVAASADSTAFRVTADSTGMTVKVAPGFALVRGHAILSTAVETITMPAADSVSRVDRVVLRLDPAANEITISVVKGTPGSGTPALTQTDTGVYEIPLATVVVFASGTTIAAAQVMDARQYVGTHVGAWTALTRPANPRLGTLGLNRTSGTWEYWSGSAWTTLAPAVTWGTIIEKPAVFAPAPHGHSWSEISDKPGNYPPASHAHSWDQIQGKPNDFPATWHQHWWDQLLGVPGQFPPTDHGHWWDQIQGKPGQFPPVDHWHGQYLESWSTINRANGSDRPHSYGPTGSTWYAVWVDGNHNFCRNTSSIRFKENVRDIEIDPAAVLALRPRIYDRRPSVNDEGQPIEGRRDEVGLIAEEVDATLPEIVVRDEEGQIDSVRYDLLGLALLPVVQDQERRIKELEKRLEGPAA